LSSIRVTPYAPPYKKIWDDFIRGSKNGFFMFFRDYMEYHSNRFKDASLLFFKNEKLTAVLPANRNSDVLWSHEGLTCGGVITDTSMKVALMLKVFDALKTHLSKSGYNKLVYKCVPYIYQRYPSDEDLYALFINNANLSIRNISSVIGAREKIKFNSGRRWRIKQAKKEGIVFKESIDFDSFMPLVENTLKKKYGVSPTHTAVEIKHLASRYPDNIHLFTVEQKSEVLSGVVIYESDTVAHAQYIASSDKGKKLSAPDLALDHLINDIYRDKPYFDFGNSNEQGGRYLNSGLIALKEELGGRGVAYDTYEVLL
jgi:hypothetical protein